MEIYSSYCTFLGAGITDLPGPQVGRSRKAGPRASRGTGLPRPSLPWMEWAKYDYILCRANS